MWSYRSVILNNGSAEEIQEQIDNLFNSYGSDGWELTSIVTGDKYSSKIVAVFKRKA